MSGLSDGHDKRANRILADIEAPDPSGQKVVLNGGLKLSILDE